VWLKNRTTTCTLDGQTLFEIMSKMKPNLENLPEWGACVFVLCEGHGKLKSRADKACWVGYSPDSKGHRVYWPEKQCTSIKFNVTFDMNLTISQQDIMTKGEHAEDSRNSRNDTSPNTPLNDTLVYCIVTIVGGYGWKFETQLGTI